jgi:hypothetical protein
MQIGEIASTAARDSNLLRRFPCVLDHDHPPASLARLNGAHQPRGARANNQHIRA